MLVLAQHSPQQSGSRARSSSPVNNYTTSSSNSSSSPSRSGKKHSNPGLARVKRHGFGNQTLQRPPFPPPSLRKQEQRSEPPPTPPEPKPGSGNHPIQQRPRPQKVQQVQQVQPVKQLLETYQQQQPEQPPQQQERSMGTKISMGLRTSQDDLVDYLIRAGLVKSPRVAAALRAVDRGKYVNPTFATHTDAYMDHPLAIGEGQTISAPHMHAICLELLQTHLQPGARVLDVGAGSGYLTAAMAKMVRPDGFVLGVEKVPELVEHAKRCIAAANGELLVPQAGGDAGGEGDQQPLLKVVHGNVLGEMLADEAPFNAIHVGAAADELHPLLLDKLAPGGRMVIPVGPRYAYQVLMAVDKDMSGHVTTEALMDVGYVPLTRPSELEDGQLL